jgi:hypothetical protein
MKALASAFHHFQQEKPNEAQRKDIYAFTLLTLEALSDSVDQTALAWEKRDYWIKSDRLRDTWRWVSEAHKHLLLALQNNAFEDASQQLERLYERINPVELPRKKSSLDLWKGAWMKWQKHRK